MPADYVLGMGAADVGAVAGIDSLDFRADLDDLAGVGVAHHAGRERLRHYVAAEQLGAAADEAAVDPYQHLVRAGSGNVGLDHLHVPDTLELHQPLHLCHDVRPRVCP